LERLHKIERERGGAYGAVERRSDAEHAGGAGGGNATGIISSANPAAEQVLAYRRLDSGGTARGYLERIDLDAAWLGSV